MNDDAALRTLRAFVEEDLLRGRDMRLADDTPLVTSGLLDSLSTLELLAFLEKRFGLHLEAHEIDWARMDTLAELVQLVMDRRNKG